MDAELMKARIVSYMWQAFFLGAWYGQADMEQYLESNSLRSVLEAISARKTSMPLYSRSSGRTVIYNLRSDEWRKAVFAKKEELKDLIDNFCKEIEEKDAGMKVEVI